MTKKSLLGIPAIALVLAVLAGCASMTVVSIDNESVTGPKRARQYGAIDPKEITVYANFKDGSRKTVSINKNDITFDNTRVGPQTVKLTVRGHSASFETEVMALTGLAVTPQPVLKKLGDRTRVLRSSGGPGIQAASIEQNYRNSWPGVEIQGVWDQMSNEKLTDTAVADECVFTGYDPNKAGRQNVTVEWKGKKAAFIVNVVAMESIRITALPTKTTYYQGESLNTAGMKVIGVWPGFPETEVSGVSASGYDMNKVGKQTVTVTFNGKSATFGIEVVPSPNGTWVGNNGVEWRINNGIMDYYVDGRVLIRRTYTISGNTMTATTTHQNYNNQGLKTKAEILQLTAGGTIPAELIEQGFAPQTIEWSVSGNTLTLIGHDVVTSAAMPPQKFTRK